mmetsp:Transcript_6205/g.15983  ORF Transcript_6205/g.15983 Transcript_6205/m.15983 type:complete len:350 (+) Transcript_6205:309-1358(+)
MLENNSFSMLVCSAAAAFFGLGFYFGVAQVEGDLAVVLLSMSLVTLALTPYLLFVFGTTDISSAALLIILSGLLRSAYLALICRGLHMDEVAAVLAPMVAMAIAGTLLSEAILGAGGVALEPLEAVAATLAVVGAVFMAGRLWFDPSLPVAVDQVEVGFDDIESNADEVQFDENPFVSRGPKLTVRKPSARDLATGSSRRHAVVLGAMAGMALGLGLGLDRKGCAAMDGQCTGFVAISLVVTQAALWPLVGRLTAGGGTPPAEHSLIRLVFIGCAGMLANFWLATAMDMGSDASGSASVMVVYASISALSAVPTRCGFGESKRDVLCIVGGLLILLGSAVAAAALLWGA